MLQRYTEWLVAYISYCFIMTKENTSHCISFSFSFQPKSHKKVKVQMVLQQQMYLKL